MVIGKGQLHGRALPSPVAARGWRPHGRLHGAGWGGAVALAEGPKLWIYVAFLVNMPAGVGFASGFLFLVSADALLAVCCR